MPTLQAKNSRNIAQSRSRADHLVRENLRAAKRILGQDLVSRTAVWLETLTRDFGFSLQTGELQIVNGHWYVTHTGLVALARRKKCRGIHIEAVDSLSDPAANRFVLKATVFPSKNSSGFAGYGDADPSNVSSLVRDAEMRVAETRAVNRALRKAYGIGICSVEEVVSLAEQEPVGESKKLPPRPPNGNYGGSKIRDRLCQIIRQHRLDASLVKSYATDFCGVKSLREATPEQVEAFVTHLSDWAEKDRNVLLCQLNSYLPSKEREVVA